MSKVRIVIALIKYLYSVKGEVKHTINRTAQGEWFLVEPAYIWIHPDDAKESIVRATNGQLYVKVGAGDQQGRYVPIGSDDVMLQRAFAESEDREPTGA